MFAVTRHQMAEWAIMVCWYSPTPTLAITQANNTNLLTNMLYHLHWCTEPSGTWRAAMISWSPLSCLRGMTHEAEEDDMVLLVTHL
jgi:hypothetical protein